MRTIDRPLLISTLALVVVGFFIFSSASLGLLARSEGARFSSVAISQLVLGVGGGCVALFVFSRIPYTLYRRFSPHLFIIAFILTFLVFVPGIGFSAKGAARWLHVFGLSFQPSEFLKLASVFLLASFYATHYQKVRTFTWGFVPLLAGLALIAIPMLLQPDTGTFIIIGAALVGVFIVAGGRLSHLLILLLITLMGLGGLALARPYVMDRITTFLDPTVDPLGAGYQINQSLIAVGSGGWFGRGYGQSVQKFNYLPEPIGDSIFSVAAEEFGFVGSVAVLLLFLFFGYRVLMVAARARDRFGGLIAVGIAILIVSQSFVNIGAMLGVVPLTGVPLIFMSHGGSALFFSLASVGIVLSVSRATRPAPIS